MKRVLLIVIDGCTPRVLGPALERGELPLLAELAAAGSLDLNCVSIFPSITPAATASIITGHYPSRHGIIGMSWSNPSNGDVLYFGDDVRIVLRRGIGTYLRDFLIALNHDRLQSPTLMQLVEQQGLSAACFNYLIFRGDTAHEVRPPLVLRMFPSMDASLTVRGPSWLCLGAFVSNSRYPSRGPGVLGGILDRFGFDDAWTLGFLRALPAASALPEFAVAYFPDYDFDSHEKGPEAALAGLRRLDRELRALFDAWGGLDRVLADACIVLTADHGHSEVGSEKRAAIVLEDVLDGFRCADVASGWREGDELLLCPNMRSAEVYLRQTDDDRARSVCTALLEDARVDQVIWRDSHDSTRYTVATRDRGSLRFHGERDGSAFADEHGGRWSVEGDLSAVDASVGPDSRLRYGVYPNALERIVGGVHAPPARHLWVTARPGYEFSLPGQQVHHRGSSHGTLHELDSLVPLLVAGHPRPRALPPAPRIVDVAPLCAHVLGIRTDVEPGAPRR